MSDSGSVPSLGKPYDSGDDSVGGDTQEEGLSIEPIFHQNVKK